MSNPEQVKCEDCMFFEKVKGSPEPGSIKSYEGTCHRNPKIIAKNTPDEWCGEWRDRETGRKFGEFPIKFVPLI